MFPSMKEPFIPPIPREQEMDELEQQWVTFLSMAHQVLSKTERVMGVLHPDSRAMQQAVETLQHVHADFADTATQYNLELKK